MKRTTLLVLLTILAAFALSASWQIGDYFVAGHEGWLGAQTGIGALNFIKHGFVELHFCVTLAPLQPTPPTKPADYYAGHPMLNYYAVALLWKLVGVSELSARLYMILLALGSIVFFFLLVRDLTGRDIPALLAAALYASFPVVRYYGHQVNGEIGLLFFVAGGLWAFNRFLAVKERKERPIWLALLAVFFLLACLMDWFSYIYAGLVAVALLLQGPRRWGAAGAVLLAMGLALGLFFLPVIMATGSPAQVAEKFFFRSGQEPGKYTYLMTLADIYLRAGKHFGWFFGLIIPLVPFGPLLWLKQKRARGDLFYLFFIVAPLSFFMMMRQVVQIHDFFMIYFGFGLAFAPVWALDRLLRDHPRRRDLILAACLVPIIITTWARSDFRSSGHANFAYLGHYLQQHTLPDEQIALKIDYPGPNHTAFYSARPIDNEPRPGNTGYRWAVLELRPDNIAQIKDFLAKYQTVFYRVYFIFDLKRPPGKLDVYRVEPQPAGSFYRYFISAERPPEKEALVESPSAVRAIGVRLGLDKPPANEYFPRGLAGTYFSKQDFTGERKDFSGGNDQLDYVWVDSFKGSEQITDLKYLVRPWGSFSLRLAGELAIPVTGLYRLQMASDDTAWFFVDDKLVLRTECRQPKTTTVKLTAGSHRARLDLSDLGTEAFLSLKIAPAADDFGHQRFLSSSLQSK